MTRHATCVVFFFIEQVDEITICWVRADLQSLALICEVSVNNELSIYR